MEICSLHCGPCRPGKAIFIAPIYHHFSLYSSFRFSSTLCHLQARRTNARFGSESNKRKRWKPCQQTGERSKQSFGAPYQNDGIKNTASQIKSGIFRHCIDSENKKPEHGKHGNQSNTARRVVCVWQSSSSHHLRSTDRVHNEYPSQ